MSKHDPIDWDELDAETQHELVSLAEKLGDESGQSGGRTASRREFLAAITAAGLGGSLLSQGADRAFEAFVNPASAGTQSVAQFGEAGEPFDFVAEDIYGPGGQGSGDPVNFESISTDVATIKRELANSVVINEDWGDDLGNLINMAMDYVDTEIDGLTAGADKANPTHIFVAPRSNDEAWQWATEATINQNAHVRLHGLGYADVEFTAGLSPALSVGPSTKQNRLEMSHFVFDINGQSMGDIIAHAAGTKCHYHSMTYGDTGSGSADSFWAHAPGDITGTESGSAGTTVERIYSGGSAPSAAVGVDLRRSTDAQPLELTVRHVLADGTTAAVQAEDPRDTTFKNIRAAGAADVPTLKITSTSDRIQHNEAQTIVGNNNAPVLDVKNPGGVVTKGNVFKGITPGIGTPTALVDYDGMEETTIEAIGGDLPNSNNPYVTIGSGASDTFLTARSGAGDTDGFVSDSGTRTRINGLGQSSGAATAGDWQVGDVIRDTANGTTYLILHDGTAVTL